MRIRNALIPAAGILLSAWLAEPGYAQGRGVGKGLQKELGREVVEAKGKGREVEKDLTASDRALERAFENRDRLPEAVQERLADLEGSIADIRQSWETEYDPGEGASDEELIAARERFEEDMATRIAESRELRKEVVASLRDDLRKQAKERELDEETRGKVDAYEATKRELEKAWRDARAALGKRAKGKDIREAKNRFLEENAELIAQQSALASEIRIELDAAGGLGNAPGRDALPEALERMRAEIQVERDKLREQQRQEREEMKSLSVEEREARRQEILEELRGSHDDIKERRRQLIEDLRDERNGGRRAED